MLYQYRFTKHISSVYRFCNNIFRDIRIVPVGRDLASGLSFPECWLNRNCVSAVTPAIGLLLGDTGERRRSLYNATEFNHMAKKYLVIHAHHLVTAS